MMVHRKEIFSQAGEDEKMTHAELIHAKYSSKLGSEVIATKKALRILEKDFYSQKERTHVVELGSGIGTLTELMFRIIPESSFQLLETNDWCLAQLENELSIFCENTNYKVYDNFLLLIEDLQNRKTVIVVDDFIDQKETYQLLSACIPEYIFIEGHRRSQRVYFAKGLREAGYQFKLKIYINSADSLKGATVFTICKDRTIAGALLTKFQIIRLVFLKTPFIVKVGQSVGVRYRFLLSLLSTSGSKKN
jgi:hypothetical protein